MSSSTFAELGVPKNLCSALERAGIETPFPIQTAAIPDALAGRDVLGRGQTGSGKTLAFGLPLLMAMKDRPRSARRPGGLVLVPTRELAMQVSDALEPLASRLDVTMTVVVGGKSYAPQIKAFRAGVDIVVATPGRLMDLVEQGEADLSRVTVTVLDEADHMADLGFMPQVTSLLDHTPKGGQRLLFSATLDRDVDKLVRRYLKDPATHSVSPATASVDAMDHHVLVVAPHDKNEVTARIAARSGRTVVFVRTKHGADRLATSLRKVGVRAGSLHGGKTQSARSATLDDFRSGTVSVLVATDVAARGIHVDDVTLVLHADMANDHKDYLHRSGRTARAGEAGTVVSLITPGQRRAAEAMTRRAGVTAGNSRVAPDSANLVEITGAQEPAGVPWEQPARSGGGSGPRGRRRSGPARGGRAAASGRSGRRSSGGSGGGGYSGGGRGGSSGRRSASRG